MFFSWRWAPYILLGRILDWGQRNTAACEVGASDD